MDEEWPAIFVLPSFEHFHYLNFHFGQFLGYALAHLFFSQQLSWVSLLTLLGL
jgi:hypothetical protein